MKGSVGEGESEGEDKR